MPISWRLGIVLVGLRRKPTREHGLILILALAGGEASRVETYRFAPARASRDTSPGPAAQLEFQLRGARADMSARKCR